MFPCLEAVAGFAFISPFPGIFTYQIQIILIKTTLTKTKIENKNPSGIAHDKYILNIIIYEEKQIVKFTHKPFRRQTIR